MTPRYNPSEIERKWQARWEADGLYRVIEDEAVSSGTTIKPNFYALTMFPYTSGDLHVGHWYAMAPSDAYARYIRMKGYQVLHPMGFDAFGLPAENAAIKSGIHPYRWTMDNIARMRQQLKSMGCIYDWQREIITCLPDYYRWTQWLFLKFYEAGLAYRALAPANWCPNCQTVLANEQVTTAGLCERCDTPVTKRDLEQWFLRITRYAEDLLNFSLIDWPERVCTMQKNWIGKSEGVDIAFGIEGIDDAQIGVFTTRPDTIFGVTFMVMAPEHPLVPRLTAPERKAEVDSYIAQTRRESEIERLSTEKEKTGVFIGAYAVNLLSGERIPIWIADYVLMSYGTGAVMGVPGHDTRDFEFAQKLGIPIRVVIAPPGWNGGMLETAYVEPGVMVNSGPFNGLPSEAGKRAVAEHVEKQGWGQRSVRYRLRDWLISRQRYWGAPIPIVYCPQCGIVPVPEGDLPVLLPEDAEFRPTGESPLKYHAPFVNTTCPCCKAPAQRETDTMDTFICSSWYFLRYTSPQYGEGAFHPEKMRYWLPVDLYTGGVEHATMHLLYARFFVKALRNMGVLPFSEPFLKLFNQGTIIYERRKMSKSRGNVVNPDHFVARMGADAVRAYLMFIGPWDQGGEWSDAGIAGIHRWLNRVWELVLAEVKEEGRAEEETSFQDIRHHTHKTIKRVTEDIQRFHFNTMLASLMEFTNFLARARKGPLFGSEAWNEAMDALLLLLAPIAPHLTEELWAQTGHPYSIHNQAWPAWDEHLAKEKEITLVIQVNGKVRDRVTVSASITEAEARGIVLGRKRVQDYLNGQEPAKFIYVPGKLVNIVP